MAVGAAYSLRPHPGNQDDAAEFFCSRARILIDIEIDSPTVATVQALLLLSAHEAARGRDSRGTDSELSTRFLVLPKANFSHRLAIRRFVLQKEHVLVPLY